MKHTEWIRPRAVVQVFVPNEYVAACETVYTCDVDSGGVAITSLDYITDSGYNGLAFVQALLEQEAKDTDKYDEIMRRHMKCDVTTSEINKENIAWWHVGNYDNSNNVPVYYWTGADGYIHYTKVDSITNAPNNS